MIWTYLFFLVSLVLVIFGARYFLSASISLSQLLRFPEIVVGATFIALATTMPEILVSVFSSASKHTSLALGNILGSGLVNLGLIFGFVLLVGGVKREAGNTSKVRSLFLFFLVLFIYFWLWFVGNINFVTGLLLIGLGFAFLGYNFRSALKESGDDLLYIETELKTHVKVLFQFLLGAFLLIVGSRFLVESGISLAQTLGLPEVIIGLTLIAVGTSVPEIMTALMSLLSGHSRVSVGNLIGATVLVFTFSLGLVGVVSGITIDRLTLQAEFILLLFFGLVGLVFAFFPRMPQRLLGFILLASYLVYFIFLI
ncbi:MAG: sodium:calcium antiporter [bacterium]|nr:sodium:calcium antiporter [bacterium]